MSDTFASQQIDDIIERYAGWKGDLINRLRLIINGAAPDITEEIKWKTKSRPEGLPVWSQNGIACFVEIWKDNVKLIFFKGSQLSNPHNIFNARLQSSTLRAVEFHEGDTVNKAGVKALVEAAISLNVKNDTR